LKKKKSPEFTELVLSKDVRILNDRGAKTLKTTGPFVRQTACC
jgi:hypothetical protein